MDAPLDRDLILRARRGDNEAYGELVMRHQTSVFNVCYRILHERSEAEDMAQETFIRAHSRLESFDLERAFGPWIRRVAANFCLNQLESHRITFELDDEHNPDETQKPEQTYEARERNEQIPPPLPSLPLNNQPWTSLRH